MTTTYLDEFFQSGFGILDIAFNLYNSTSRKSRGG